MTKVIAYTALLYGAEYLGWAIRSIIDHIDEYHVIYDKTGHGSHGSVTERTCPDTRNQLYDIAVYAAGSKLKWHDAGPFQHEGYQRESIHQYAPDADVILVLDADEIWRTDRLFRQELEDMHNLSSAKTVRVSMIHYWRSFYRAILHDPAFPTRIIFPKHSGGEMTSRALLINHMGYSQRSEIVEFKQYVHGHRGEWRKDINWFEDKFMANAQQDVHPVGSEYWNPEKVDPWDYMPAFMRDHPYAGLEVIP